jgi:tRNA1(Val) A37 N6-methylase TrmN6
VIHGDLREAVPAGEKFDLITGTPPYIPLGSGGTSPKPQKTPCCLETRGGIEDYCLAAAAALAPGGVFVVCAGVQGQPSPDRGFRAAAGAGLRIVRVLEVIPREGKPALMHVYVMRHDDGRGLGGGCKGRGVGEEAGGECEDYCVKEQFVVRLEGGELGPDMVEARRFMGLPP